MKILHVIPGYEPAWGFGGTVTAIANLCRGLAEQGNDVTVYTTNADGEGGKLNDVPVGEPVDRDGVTVRYFNCDIDPERAFYSRGLSKALTENVSEFDIVHSSTVWQWHQTAVHRACTRNDTKYVVTPHSCLMEQAIGSVGNASVKYWYWRLHVRRTMCDANAIHYLSEMERRRSVIPADATSSFVLPNGIDPNRFRYDPDTQRRLRSRMDIGDDFVLLFLGRVAPKKRLERVIKALPQLRDVREDIRFVVAGYIDDEEYYEDLRNTARRLGVDGRIEWYGPVDSDALSTFYSVGDLMVLPSDVEGVSMATLEAMSSSLPLLVSDEVANHDDIAANDAGVVVSPDVDAVTDALAEILREPGRVEEMGQNARRLLVDSYSHRAIAGEMSRAYRDILDGARHEGLGWCIRE